MCIYVKCYIMAGLNKSSQKLAGAERDEEQNPAYLLHKFQISPL